jgi:trans-aconitate 2-methyltransferase
MPSWNSEQYLRFARERTQPSVDLAYKVELRGPRRIIDLGCGPGNSTEVLMSRWPSAFIEGLDSSADMIAAAQKAHPVGTWTLGQIQDWDPENDFDLVFSNAALQWVPDQLTLLPRLFGRVAPGGAMAFQVPADRDSPFHRAMHAVAESPQWKERFPTAPVSWAIEPAASYYDALARLAARIDVWTTEYLHVLDDVAAVAAWYRGTGLRPWLDALPSDAEREEFLQDYTAQIAPHLPPRADGKVLFPFRRLFVIAYRSAV